jgi:hypothetical protein
MFFDMVNNYSTFLFWLIDNDDSFIFGFYTFFDFYDKLNKEIWGIEKILETLQM